MDHHHSELLSEINCKYNHECEKHCWNLRIFYIKRDFVTFYFLQRSRLYYKKWRMNIDFINENKKSFRMEKTLQNNSKAPTQTVVDSSQPQWGSVLPIYIVLGSAINK
jgi:hypothetical protein